MTSVFKITPTTQKYDWGKIGNESAVARLAVASNYAGFSLEENEPYAELWMGTHPKSPSHLVSSAKESLSSHLASHPQLIGERVLERFPDAAGTGNLPFLFKVLSIEKALSIQTHPDKETAEKLHAEQPDIYKDPNHKPEMALAITQFKALCGFLPLPIIATNLTSTPELSALVPPSILNTFIALSSSRTPTGPSEKTALKDLFSAIMTAPTDEIKRQLETLIQRLKGSASADEVVHLVLKLNSDFPGDVGVFCAYLLNYVRLKPGEAIFLGAGEPHAYVSGEIMECMANSDNVIRAGLTPKLRDIPNLVSGLTYTASPPSKHVVDPQPFSPSQDDDGSKTTLYDPPIPEFSVLQSVIGKNEWAQHRAIDGPSVAIVLRGMGRVTWSGDTEDDDDDDAGTMDVGMGDVFFVGAGTKIKLEEHGSEDDFAVYRAFVEV